MHYSLRFDFNQILAAFYNFEAEPSFIRCFQKKGKVAAFMLVEFQSMQCFEKFDAQVQGNEFLKKTILRKDVKICENETRETITKKFGASKKNCFSL